VIPAVVPPRPVLFVDTFAVAASAVLTYIRTLRAASWPRLGLDENHSASFKKDTGAGPLRHWPVLGVIAFGAICALFVGLWSPGQKTVTEKVSASVVAPPLPASAVPVPVASVASSVPEEVVPAPPLPSASVARPRAPVRATDVKPRLPAAAASEREPPPKNDGPGSLI
jgi:hypothetical protein